MNSRLPLIDLTVLDMVDVAQEMEYGPNRPHWFSLLFHFLCDILRPHTVHFRPNSTNEGEVCCPSDRFEGEETW